MISWDELARRSRDSNRSRTIYGDRLSEKEIHKSVLERLAAYPKFSREDSNRFVVIDIDHLSVPELSEQPIPASKVQMRSGLLRFLLYRFLWLSEYLA